MDVFKEEQISTAHLGHLGLVADKIDSLKIIDLIDNRLPISEAFGAKVSHGERVAAMIMNGLGFIDSRLYLFPEFLSDKPLNRLFNRHVQAKWFNDDATGRCLDEISAYGTTKLFTELSLTIGHARGLLGKSTHIDTTTLSLFGDFEQPLLKEVRTLVSTPERDLTWTKLSDGYSYCATVSDYKDVKQRWLMFFSEVAYRREGKTLDKKIKIEGDHQNKAWWHLSNQMFTCQHDARKQAEAQKKLLKFHEVTYSIIEVKKHTS